VEAKAVAKVVIKKGRAKPLFFRHPWVFSGAVEKIEGEFQGGDVVEVVDCNGQFIAKGYINAESKILVRLLTWEPDEVIDDNFWRRRIENAIHLRERILGLPINTDAYRLVFSEGDGLPGLIVDKYRDYLAVQFLTLGANRWREQILDILEDLVQPAGIIERRGAAFQEIIRPAVEQESTEAGASEGGEAEPDSTRSDREMERSVLLRGNSPDGPIEIRENGLNFYVDIQRGQKTGFYLDQRENRLAVLKYCQEQSVLDCFSYSGAFAIYATARGQAREAVTIETSVPATNLAKQNAELNGVSNVEIRTGDVMNEIRRLKEEGKTFDMVILDPPKFARSRAGVPRACGRYREVNLLAMQVLKPHGIMVTCSCSQHVSEQQFARILNEAAREAKRKVRIIEHRSQACDHPVPASCVETKYLKCFICHVE